MDTGEIISGNEKDGLSNLNASVAIKKSQKFINLEKIENIIIQILDSLANDKPPILQYSNTTSWKNIQLEADKGLYASSQVTTTKWSRFTAKKFSRILFTLSEIYNLILTNTYSTKRELFYQNVKLFESQRNLDHVIDIISRILSTPRKDLHIYATSKGLVAGSLQFTESRTHFIDCSASNFGILIPNNVDEIDQITSSSKFILIIEKDAIFQKLLDDHIFSFLPPCIIVTGKGFPDLNTRLFIRKIWMCLKVPTLALVDADPHGIEIMSVYKYGSKAMSADSTELTIPNLYWVGLLPSDVQKLQLPESALLPLSESDNNKAESLETRPFMRQELTWMTEINLLRRQKRKAELEALNAISNNFLSRIYLPNKIRFSGLI